MDNMSAMFDEEATQLFSLYCLHKLISYMSIMTLTFDLQNQYGPSSHYG